MSASILRKANTTIGAVSLRHHYQFDHDHVDEYEDPHENHDDYDEYHDHDDVMSLALMIASVMKTTMTKVSHTH